MRVHETPIPIHSYWVQAMTAEASNGKPADERAAQILSAFTREVFTPMVASSGMPAAERRRLLAEIRNRLDIVAEVIDLADGGRSVPDAAAAGAPAEQDWDETPGQGEAGLGRNQRSRVRELVLLDVLGRDSKAVSLQQLMSALAQRGFHDSPSAVVSQLHRLKKLDLIRQPAGSTGMYEITTEGLGHGRNLRSSFGPYLP